MFDIGKQIIDVKCPNCKRVHKISLNDVKKSKKKLCGCKTEITFSDDGTVKKSINSINKSLKNFQNTIKKIGK